MKKPLRQIQPKPFLTIIKQTPPRELLKIMARIFKRHAAPFVETVEQPANYPIWKCSKCGSDKGTWFSRCEPMGNFCENCGHPAD